MFGENIINGATDITGFGLIGHLKEMIDSSNIERTNNNFKKIRAVLNLMALKAYPNVMELIRKGVRSSLFEGNRKIYNEIVEKEFNKREIIFEEVNNLCKDQMNDKVALLLDPQTCGPILISCHPKYKKYFKKNWYQIGRICDKDI
tara:strand:- start:116 stop:553 length:438 start_codon:yes stop_codon:yes gene_type:complete